MSMITHWKCTYPGCGKEYDTLTLRGVTWALEHPVLDNSQLTQAQREKLCSEGYFDCCPSCDSTDRMRLTKAGLGIRLGGAAGQGRLYPYFDRGLGMHIETAAQRDRVMAERGLVPLENDLCPIAATEAREAAEDRAEAAYQEQAREDATDSDLMQTQDLYQRVMDEQGGDSPAERKAALQAFRGASRQKFGSTSLELQDA